jgi:hypothetical protein
MEFPQCNPSQRKVREGTPYSNCKGIIISDICSKLKVFPYLMRMNSLINSITLLLRYTTACPLHFGEANEALIASKLHDNGKR